MIKLSMTPSFNLQKATGAGIRVALIDSGVNANISTSVCCRRRWLGLRSMTRRQIRPQQDFSDRIGHGTALAGILRAKAPQVKCMQSRCSVMPPGFFFGS